MFDLLKVQRLHEQRFPTRPQAKDETTTELLWYNRRRWPSTLAESASRFQRITQ